MPASCQKLPKVATITLLALSLLFWSGLVLLDPKGPAGDSIGPIHGSNRTVQNSQIYMCYGLDWISQTTRNTGAPGGANKSEKEHYSDERTSESIDQTRGTPGSYKKKSQIKVDKCENTDLVKMDLIDIHEDEFQCFSQKTSFVNSTML